MLNYKLITASPIELAPSDVKIIEEIISWKRPAFFPKPGRSAWLKLTKPITILQGNSHIQIKSVKIKGVGLFNHYGRQLKPCADPFYRFNLHLGFTPNGKFTRVASDPAPMGGMTLDRGSTEFFISAMLNMHGCPAQVPLLLYQYDEADMTFDAGKNAPTSFCVTVTGLPNDNWLRVRAIDSWMNTGSFSKNNQVDEQTFRVLDTWVDSLSIPEHAYKPLATLAKIFYLYGQTLRKFHEIGYYRHNGSTQNFIYCPYNKAVFFTDLDSSRPLIECSSVTKPLQQMRDVSSPLSRIAYRLLNKMYIRGIPPERIFDNDMHNPFKSMLLGYYHDVSVNAVDNVVLCIRKDYERRYLLALQRHASPSSNNFVGDDLSYQEYFKNLENLYWVNFDELYPFYTAVVWDLHEQSKLGKRYPHQISKSDMHDSIAELISSEFALYVKEST